jgi:transposase
MAKQLISDALWSRVRPLLPAKPAHPKGGHPFTISDRAALTGIVFVLKTGIPWEYLPREMGCGSGMTCWRRLRDWQRAGVWEGLHRALLDVLGEAGAIDWERASADSATAPAKGVKRGPRGRCTSGRTRPTGGVRAPSTTW